MLRQAMNVTEVPVVRDFLIRVVFLVWGVMIGMWIGQVTTDRQNVNDLLKVGFVLIDPEGHEVARFDE